MESTSPKERCLEKYMDAFLLSSILLQFKAASEHWAIALLALLEPSWFVFAKLAFVLLILGLLVDHGRFFGVALLGLLGLGFMHVAFLHGWEWMQSMSDGVRHISGRLGAPAYDPSAIIALGAHVADPLLKGTTEQGILSYIWNPASIVFALSGLAILLAFCILAFAQFVLLLLNYLLIGAAPFCLLFLPVPGLSAISQRWISMACGNLTALFVCGLIAGIMNDLSDRMVDQYRAVFINATVSLTWVEMAQPLCTAIVLAAAFAWIPLQFFREASGVAMNLLAGGRMALAGAAAAISIPASGRHSSNPSSGQSQKQINSQSNSGGSLGPATAPSQSHWNPGRGNRP